MSVIMVPVLLDRFDNVDVTQAITEIEGMVGGENLTLCHSSPETSPAGALVKSSSGHYIGRITATRMARISALYGPYSLRSARFDSALIFGCQIKLVLEQVAHEMQP